MPGTNESNRDTAPAPGHQRTRGKRAAASSPKRHALAHGFHLNRAPAPPSIIFGCHRASRRNAEGRHRFLSEDRRTRHPRSPVPPAARRPLSLGPGALALHSACKQKLPFLLCFALQLPGHPPCHGHHPHPPPKPRTLLPSALHGRASALSLPAACACLLHTCPQRRSCCTAQPGMQPRCMSGWGGQQEGQSAVVRQSRGVAGSAAQQRGLAGTREAGAAQS